MEDLTRSERITVRITPEERIKFEAEASDVGMKLAEYAYSKLAEDSISIETKRLESLIYQLQEDTANRIDNLELKIQENQKELTDDFGEFGKGMASLLISKFNQLQTTPATQTAKKKRLLMNTFK